MPVIQTLNATNASYVLQYGNYTDFNIWLVLFVATILLILASRYTRDELGKLMVSILAIMFSIGVSYASLSVAKLDYTTGAQLVDNVSTVNQSITYQYVFPVMQVISSPWITAICVVLCIIAILNAVDIALVFFRIGAPKPGRDPEFVRLQKGGKI